MGRRRKLSKYGIDLDVHTLDQSWVMEMINQEKKCEILSCALRREVKCCKECSRYKQCWKRGEYVG